MCFPTHARSDMPRADKGIQDRYRSSCRTVPLVPPLSFSIIWITFLVRVDPCLRHCPHTEVLSEYTKELSEVTGSVTACRRSPCIDTRSHLQRYDLSVLVDERAYLTCAHKGVVTLFMLCFSLGHKGCEKETSQCQIRASSSPLSTDFFFTVASSELFAATLLRCCISEICLTRPLRRS